MQMKGPGFIYLASSYRPSEHCIERYVEEVQAVEEPPKASSSKAVEHSVSGALMAGSEALPP